MQQAESEQYSDPAKNEYGDFDVSHNVAEFLEVYYLLPTTY